MWLINTSTLKLEEFYGDVPKYAILSHRWKKDEELSFGGLEAPHPHSGRSGYEKVNNFCAEARKRNIAYAWADTCCIDKKSSSELSEAINSMYTFYSQAKICYVYLYDVSSPKDIEQSSWFSRGWTLQELLAPSKMNFFNQRWKLLGSRNILALRIQKITGIPKQALRNFNPKNYCVAERFSWSAKRETTREEDSAYCLLGLFQVNMPLLYGEGTRAFQRLQEEIMKIDTDTSIFLWQGPAMDAFGMLAASPSCFSVIPDSIRRMDISRFSVSDGWSINNAGIHIKASIRPYLFTESYEGIFQLRLGEATSGYGHLGASIFIRKHRTEQGIPAFARVTIDGVACTSTATEKHYDNVTEVRLLRYPLQDICTPNLRCQFDVSARSNASCKCRAYQNLSGNAKTELQSWQKLKPRSKGWMPFQFPINPRNATGVHGYLLFTLVSDIQILVCFGLSWYFEPECIILPFCKQILKDGLRSSTISRQYDSISRDQSGSFKLFDNDSNMICLRGSHSEEFSHIQDYHAAIGVSVNIGKEWGGANGCFATGIELDIERFIRYYVRNDDLSSYDSIDGMVRGTFDQLLEVDRKIHAVRCKKWNLQGRSLSDA